MLDAQGQIKAALKRTGIPLGMSPDFEFATAQQVVLASGDIVLLLTDGIEEATAPDESLFGIDRIIETVRANRSEPAQKIVQALYEEVRAFANHAPQIDDITAIVIKVE